MHTMVFCANLHITSQYLASSQIIFTSTCWTFKQKYANAPKIHQNHSENAITSRSPPLDAWLAVAGPMCFSLPQMLEAAGARSLDGGSWPTGEFGISGGSRLVRELEARVEVDDQWGSSSQGGRVHRWWELNARGGCTPLPAPDAQSGGSSNLGRRWQTGVGARGGRSTTAGECHIGTSTLVPVQ